MAEASYVVDLGDLRMGDVDRVGGKNASLGEMISQLSRAGIRVPGGFATTADAYRTFLAHDGLKDRIEERLRTLDPEDVTALANCGAEIREWIVATPFPARLADEIASCYRSLANKEGDACAVAVRSSATAEDLPDASFAGQQETFLNIRGLDNVLTAMKHVFASLYNDRAISYRVHKGFEHAAVALSAGVQRMVRSDIGASGVLFTLDTESGFEDVVFITASWGLGEMVVQGAVNPDEFYVHKPMLRAGKPAVIRRSLGSKQQKMIFASGSAAGNSVATVDVPQKDSDRFCLSDADVLELARFALKIEEHYQRPMDIEWGRDGVDGKLYILQARPETVKSRKVAGGQARYRLKGRSEILASGRAIGQKIGSGSVHVVRDASEMSRVMPGDVLVTDMTDPNWEPVMKRAAAIVTNRGGRTCHAAIIARELGIPAVVGCGDATESLKDEERVTVSCAEGDTGNIYRGILEVEILSQSLGEMPECPVKITMNIGNPQLAFDFQSLPNWGVGLARLEFVINNMIRVHPKAIIDYPGLPAALKREVEHAARGYANPRQFFIDKLTEGIATIGAAFWPKPVIVRLSDFKSNEYKKLIGGANYEPDEENPMLGFRGASRYISASFRECFELECLALRQVRNDLGLINVEVMVPFVRTLTECRQVIDLLASNGLRRGEEGLRLIMMCEVPSNAVLADQFLEYFDGFSIGSNDLTQLTLGLDRDSGLVAEGFDERDPAVQAMLRMAIQACRKAGKYVGICGQGPSDHPDFAMWLVKEGIESLSLNPDTVAETWRLLAREAGTPGRAPTTAC
ncbi:MAG: phosphoenolpyruvate synthase [Betaproteobacteria bacterium]|nr:phosphoenolpyruvate synthase [Betaproteobacteria bacterium]